LTKAFIEDVKRRLEKHGVVKIRVLKSYRRMHICDINELAEETVSLNGGRIYDPTSSPP